VAFRFRALNRWRLAVKACSNRCHFHGLLQIGNKVEQRMEECFDVVVCVLRMEMSLDRVSIQTRFTTLRLLEHSLSSCQDDMTAFFLHFPGVGLRSLPLERSWNRHAPSIRLKRLFCFIKWRQDSLEGSVNSHPVWPRSEAQTRKLRS
jgi:hypothetical protein